ncbi:MAG: hypothetical protein RL427_335 [Bacteroidota bacterium]|jgi:hypothetical protein
MHSFDLKEDIFIFVRHTKQNTNLFKTKPYEIKNSICTLFTLRITIY